MAYCLNYPRWNDLLGITTIYCTIYNNRASLYHYIHFTGAPKKKRKIFFTFFINSIFMHIAKQISIRPILDEMTNSINFPTGWLLIFENEKIKGTICPIIEVQNIHLK